MSWYVWPQHGSGHGKSSLNCIHIQCTANSHHHSWTWSCSPRCSDPLWFQHRLLYQDGYIKLMSRSKTVLSISKGSNYSCLWYLDLWFIKACLVGQCLWHIGQENPEVETCLASTWFWTWEIFFELYPHSVHCQRPSLFLNMRLSTRMFRASIVSAWGPSSRYNRFMKLWTNSIILIYSFWLQAFPYILKINFEHI